MMVDFILKNMDRCGSNLAFSEKDWDVPDRNKHSEE